MEFETVAAPTKSRAGRKPLPNPFVGKFPTAEGEAIKTVVEGTKDSTEVRRLVRQARQAARAVDKTARVEITEKPFQIVELKFWTVERIERKARA